MIVKLANIAVEGDILHIGSVKKNSLYWHFLTPQFPKIKWSFDISSEISVGSGTNPWSQCSKRRNLITLTSTIANIITNGQHMQIKYSLSRDFISILVFSYFILKVFALDPAGVPLLSVCVCLDDLLDIYVYYKTL